MLRSMVWTSTALVFLFCALPLVAQQIATPANGVVPAMVNFSGVLTDAGGMSPAGMTGITFALYKDAQGGAPLWLETQNVQIDRSGHFKVMLGEASSHGLPAELFVSGEARWLGVQAQGRPEQTRVLLLSVPYALKAGDAQTIGGLSASAFVMAAPATGASAAPSSGGTQAANPAVGGGGTTNFIPLWTPNGSTLGNSVFFQSGSGASAKVGLGITTPLATLDINGMTLVRGVLETVTKGFATPTKGFNSNPLDQEASSYSSSTKKAVMQHFEWQAEPTGNNTNNPGATLNLLFGTDLNTPTETGVKISKGGIFTFAAGQTFPGTGDITAVNAGTDLTGGGTSGNVTLNLDTTKVPQLGSSNTFSANQTVNGTVTATSFSGSGAGLTNVNAAQLGGLSAGAFAQLAANNVFTGSEQQFKNAVIVGPITSFTEGELAAGSPSVNNPALGTVGFTTVSGSGGNGGDAMVSFGGSGDFLTNNGNTGGVGLSVEGGGGSTGGAAIFALGGGAIEGGCCSDGPGGFFEGGSNNFSGDGIDAEGGGAWAGQFFGSVNITGTLFAATKDFKIDHPLDPANKYLLHASVESSEMMNIYSGNVATDGHGEAVVQLPAWFEALNTDFRYQLTVIGQFAQAIIGRKIANGQFSIRTSSPNVEVSWQVTAVRQDAYAKANPLVVEQEKEARLRGFYVHPELYGAPEEKQIEWGRHPDLMRRAKAGKTRQRSSAAKPATMARN